MASRQQHSGDSHNPYAAPRADLVQQPDASHPPLAVEQLRGVRFRRTVLWMLGIVRFVLGMTLVLTGLFMLWTDPTFACLVPLAQGVLYLLAGSLLWRQKEWGRRLSMGDALLQMILATFVLSWHAGDGLTAQPSISFMALFSLAWSGSYLRVLVSPLTRAACDPNLDTGKPPETEPPRFLLRLLVMVALLFYAGLGALLAHFNLHRFMQLLFDS